MADNQDSTWTIKRSDGRGLKALANYRYKLSQTSGGELDVSYGQDRQFLDQQNANLPPDKRDGKYFNRWNTRYKNYFDLPNNYIQRTQLNMMSDLRYVQDFHRIEMDVLGDPALENKMSLTKNTEETHLSIDATHYTNLLKTDPLEDNKDSVHRLPYIRFSHTPRKFLDTPMLFDLDAHYVNFSRDGKSYDNVTRNRAP
jgi:LPS-assembly protein